MTRILYAWELGGGLGHTQRLLQLSRHPGLVGQESIMAIPPPSASGAYLDDLGVRHVSAPASVQAPPLHAPPSTRFRASGHADILAWHGYTHASVLDAQIKAWRKLLDDVAPDLVIADFAPTLTLAARHRVPVICAGNGFCTPPDHLPQFPSLQAGDGHPATGLVPQARIHQVVADVLHDDPDPSPTLTGWFRCVASLALVYPHLDPYDGVRAVAATGPVVRIAGPMPPPTSPHVFAYLSSAYPALEAVLDALDRLEVPTSVCVRSDWTGTHPSLSHRRFAMVQPPFDLHAMLHRSSFFVHHGALGSSHALLDAGRPQLVLPHQLENTLTAQRLMRLRVAVGLGYLECHRLPERLQQLLTEPGWTARAQAVARDLQATDWPGAKSVVTAARPWLSDDPGAITNRASKP